MKTKILFVLIMSITICLLFAQGDINDRTILGKDFAEKYLESALMDMEFNIVGKKFLVENQEIAVNIAESILFNIYGEKNIQKQKPYEIYNINNYWVIFGTLPKNFRGGTFKVIISEKNGEIVLVGHDK